LAEPCQWTDSRRVNNNKRKAGAKHANSFYMDLAIWPAFDLSPSMCGMYATVGEQQIVSRDYAKVTQVGIWEVKKG
jgi:hypothetical protein